MGLDFHKKLARWKETEFNILDKVKMKDFTENKHEEDSAQTRIWDTWR